MTLTNQRWHAIIEYDGTNYHGWQKQHKVKTIQAIVEQKLSQIADHAVTVHAAGRTDKGVHASGMSIHFDSNAKRSKQIWLRALNSLLPRDIRCHKVQIAPENFHARHLASSRTYCYQICNNKEIQPMFSRFNSWWIRKELDIPTLKIAIKLFEGTHDFSGYRGKDCQAKSPIKKIIATNITIEDNMIFINITGNSFLHHMVRNMIGAAVITAQKKQNISWLEQTLTARKRVPEIPMAPAHGLTFIKANYPEYEIPKS